jgi:putative transposase
VLEFPRSSYYHGQQHQRRVDVDRERLKAKVVSLHAASRGAAGSRTLSAALRAEGETVGRYKTRRLM